MELLKALGVDSTLWVHLACFIVSYLALTNLILKPYGKALRERESRTVGSEETAVKLVGEANELQSEYEKKARAINVEIKSFYDQSRTTASKDYERLVEVARGEAAKVLETSRAHISTEVQAARRTLSAEAPAVAATIASKLAGKEISL